MTMAVIGPSRGARRSIGFQSGGLVLMADDASERHSTLEFAEADVARLVKQEVPAEKICLGVPFDGRGIADSSKVAAFAEIVRKPVPARERDDVDARYGNGPKTIERKTWFALSMTLAGVTARNVGQDAAGDASRLRVIWRTAQQEAARQS